MSGRSAIRAVLALLVVTATSAAVAIGLQAGEGDIGRHVVITAPADGAQVRRGSVVAVNAQGFDPTGVRRWEVRAGGERVAGDDLGDGGPTHVPIDATWRAPTASVLPPR